MARQDSSTRIRQWEKTRDYGFQIVLSDDDIESQTARLTKANSIRTSLGYAAQGTTLKQEHARQYVR